MNIVYIEGRLSQLDEQRKQIEGSNDPHYYDLEFFEWDKKRYEITGDIIPSIFFKKML